jgi:hypothetical protein
VKRVSLVLAVVLFGIAVTCSAGAWFDEHQSFVAIAQDHEYQSFAYDANGAMITNLSGEPLTGLRITFSGPVPGFFAYGIGATVGLDSNEGGTVILIGDIPAYGSVVIGWAAEGVGVTGATWLSEGTAVGDVDIAAPIAVMKGELDVSPKEFPFVQAVVTLDGGQSRSPGSPIVSYTWEWSDGLIQHGETTTRTELVSVFGELNYAGLTVTLTVVNAAGESSTVTRRVLQAQQRHTEA